MADLRHEFSIGDRFSKVEHKINHVQSNTKFFLEILNHQKSNKLEWIIIVLIAAEIVLSCIDLYHQLLGFDLASRAAEESTTAATADEAAAPSPRKPGQ